ncbi:hypothetical protein BH23CHL5_BH23CHL5_14030 [soil metagenome]
MPIQDVFSHVEWTVLTELPIRVVASSMSVDPVDGMGALLEEVTGITQLSQGAASRLDSLLVQEIFEFFIADEGSGLLKLPPSQREVAQLVPETIALARDVALLLTERVEQRELDSYRAWLLETAEAVCIAAKSGRTILGVGGTRLTESESGFLEKLRDSFAAGGF